MRTAELPRAAFIRDPSVFRVRRIVWTVNDILVSAFIGFLGICDLVFVKPLTKRYFRSFFD